MTRPCVRSAACAALALVFALLAHDLFMASGVHAEAPAGSHEHHGGISAGLAPPSGGASAPMHPDGCGAAIPVLSSQKPITSGPGVSDQVASGTNRVEPVQLAVPAHPPTRPPAARRALFQVYRI
jgi:hypothetical protein